MLSLAATAVTAVTAAVPFPHYPDSFSYDTAVWYNHESAPSVIQSFAWDQSGQRSLYVANVSSTSTYELQLRQCDAGVYFDVKGKLGADPSTFVCKSGGGACPVAPFWHYPTRFTWNGTDTINGLKCDRFEIQNGIGRQTFWGTPTTPCRAIVDTGAEHHQEDYRNWVPTVPPAATFDVPAWLVPAQCTPVPVAATHATESGFFGGAASASAAAPPLVAQQWSANYSQANYHNGTLDIGYTNPAFELLHLDVPNNRYRMQENYWTEHHPQGVNQTQIWSLDTPTSYYIETEIATGVISLCHKLPIPPGSFQPNVTLSLLSVDLGAGTLAGGESVELWEAHRKLSESVEQFVNYAVQATASAGNAPMLLRQNSTTFQRDDPSHSQWLVRDNTKDLIVGPQAVPEWMFVPPAECNDQLPKAKVELLKAAAARKFW